MKISEILVASAIFSILAIGCRKEYSCENCQQKPKLNGIWKLLHFDVNVFGSTTYSTADGPWFSSLEYKTITTKNEGMYTIDDHYITASGLSCEAIPSPLTEIIQWKGDSTVKQNGGFGWFIYPHDVVIKYQMVEADSIYFPGNGPLFMPDAQSWVIWNANPSSGKYLLEGNILSIHTVITRDSIFLDGGVYKNVFQKDSGYIRLERQ